MTVNGGSGKRRYSSNHSRAGDIFMMKSSHQVLFHYCHILINKDKLLWDPDQTYYQADWSQGGGGEDWLRRRTGRGDYWEEETGRSCREWVPALGHIISCIILLAELVLWIQVYLLYSCILLAELVLWIQVYLL